MTCIVAFKIDNGSVVLAGDKAGSDGWTKNVYVRPKVFQNGEFFIGYCGSFYAGQLLEHVCIPPVKNMHITDDEFKLSQDRKLDICADYENKRGQLISGFFLQALGFPKQDIDNKCQIVLDSETNETFSKHEAKPIKL